MPIQGPRRRLLHELGIDSAPLVGAGHLENGDVAGLVVDLDFDDLAAWA